MSGGLTFRTVTVRVPESGEVRVPKDYAHEFASLPLSWVSVQSRSKYVDFPMLDPATYRALRSYSMSTSMAEDETRT